MTTHAVIVGSGIAGVTVALHAAAHGCRVTLVTKDVLDHANTRYAQGGIAGVMFDDDRVEDHVRDTLVAGAGLCDEEAVRVLAEEGPQRIRELISLGVGFDRAPDGAFVKGLEAAHSYPRILHAGGDATGTAIEKTLVGHLRSSGVEVMEHAFLIDVIVRGGRARGVELLVGEAPDAPGNALTLPADAVVLATGGAGELFAHSTNPTVATADGVAAALRAGAHVQDLEFVQFHPTIIAAGQAFLISEAVRGEGATLIDEHGRRFAFDAHPDGELAPRDVVARAIAAQMNAQDGRAVLLDATHVHSEDADERAAFLAERFPTIDRAVRARGYDWARTPIPVTPAAHYLMGGVTTDLYGRSTVPGLYAVGETARTGVHGANRLASNSLLEGAVFGARTGDVLTADADRDEWPQQHPEPSIPDRVDPLPAPPAFSRHALQALLWEHAGLVRDEAGLAHAAEVIAAWRGQPRTARTEFDYENENLLLVAEHLVLAAIRRTDSVGAHFRSDATATQHEVIPC
ncbi:L-aspartate oxidase [Microbacterium sp. C7(2022)]|uniref:L-aspartate oxidase n=1 Tax=Microbacterium sp. C7(2022) TaxID=2992759 RepID=UPI00237BB210|nr:L-aspartate oxidase [Microbacterium sp. C7(2022)]MDE0545740.1 L-aspartate oxidase [Microbacterium sp. C7(2022)]